MPDVRGFFPACDGANRGVMKGFFDLIEVAAPSAVRKAHNPCEACGLYKTVRSPKLGVTGQGRLNILYLGESQGVNEDLQGRQFVGEAGQVLRKALASIGLSFERDLYALNAVRCFTWKTGKAGNPISRSPTDLEIQYCHEGTWRLIRELKPKAIWLAGLVPLQSYLLDKDQDRPTMAKWRGWAIPDQELGCWVIPMYHPSYVLRSPKNHGLYNLFLRDLERALEQSEQPFFVNRSRECLRLLDSLQAQGLLQRLLRQKPEFVVIDYETTGLKPHKRGHDILYVGICPDDRNSYAIDLRNPGTRELFIRFLQEPAIKLGAHNIQMEQLWTRVILGIDIPHERWAWDSMIAAHVCDNRSGITSLEFQAAVRYGDWSYKKSTEAYLKCPSLVVENGRRRKSGANDFNRISDCPQKDIMTRVALDALYTRWLCLDQMRELEQAGQPMKRGRTVLEAYWLFHEGTLALGDTCVDGGLIFDRDYFRDQKEQLSREREELVAQILDSKPASLWRSKTGKTLNPSSDEQLAKLLFDYYEISPLSFTEKTERGKVTYELLQSLEQHPELGQFCQCLLRYSKIEKLVSTYIEGFEREEVDGVIYPILSLHIPRTYRSSSSSPNFQNIPSRDPFSMKLIRGGLYPWPGQRGLGVDYGSHEFILACCYSRDPMMIKYIREGGDPHGDQAQRLFLVTKEQLTKQLRYIAKNGWVFPQQYGSWYEACARNMWSMASKCTLEDGTPVYDHLKRKGIRTLTDFIEHCRAEEIVYWKKFAGLKAWQEEWIARYERDGVVPMYHGFRATGLLTRNEILNYSIQGTAFHFLLESFVELNRIRRQEGWKTRLIGQIHDEIRFSVDPDEFDYIVQITTWVMRDLMQHRHSDFLVVPLKVEFKASEVDQPWSAEKPL